MPVRKFRSAEELNRLVWRTPGDPELYRTMATLWAVGARLHRKALRPGVRRFRTIEELDAATPKWRDTPGAEPGPGRTPDDDVAVGDADADRAAELKLRPTTKDA